MNARRHQAPIEFSAVIGEDYLMDERSAAAEEQKPRVADPFVAHRFVLGDVGSLAETMGTDEADRYLDEHSLTRISRVRAARRLGRIVFDT